MYRTVNGCRRLVSRRRAPRDARPQHHHRLSVAQPNHDEKKVFVSEKALVIPVGTKAAAQAVRSNG